MRIEVVGNWARIRRYEQEEEISGARLVLEDGSGGFLIESGIDVLVNEYTGTLFGLEDGSGRILYENSIIMSTEAA